jgi:hypothetical protein
MNDRQEYQLYLHSPHWKDFTARFTALPENQSCCVCPTTTHLDINHLTYARRGAELLTDAVRLCRRHRREFHKRMEERGYCVCLPHSTEVLASLRAVAARTARREHLVSVASRLGDPPAARPHGGRARRWLTALGQALVHRRLGAKE